MKKRSILFKLALSQAREKRNILVVVAIIMTSVLFSVLFTVAVSLINSFEIQTIKQTNNSAHAAIMYIDDEKYNILKAQEEMYKLIGYEKIVSESVYKGEELLNNAVFVCMDGNAAEMTFCNVTEGNYPSEAGEIALAKEFMKGISSELKIGDEIDFTFAVDGVYSTRKFKISGIYEAGKFSDVNFLLVSERLVDELIQENDRNNFVVHAYFQFNEKSKIQEKLALLIENCNMQNEQYNVNWAYLSNSIGDDSKVKTGMSLVIVAIILTGYLLINNIYQIMFLNNTRFYGLLKTIGFSMSQLRAMILMEAMCVSVVGISIGNIMGYVIGNRLYPYILQMTNVEYFEQKYDFRILILTSLFTLITVVVSILKPCEYLRKVTPIEATRL